MGEDEDTKRDTEPDYWLGQQYTEGDFTRDDFGWPGEHGKTCSLEGH